MPKRNVCTHAHTCIPAGLVRTSSHLSLRPSDRDWPGGRRQYTHTHTLPQGKKKKNKKTKQKSWARAPSVRIFFSPIHQQSAASEWTRAGPTLLGANWKRPIEQQLEQQPKQARPRITTALCASVCAHAPGRNAGKKGGPPPPVAIGSEETKTMPPQKKKNSE